MAAERGEDSADLVVRAADDGDRRQRARFGRNIEAGVRGVARQRLERADLRLVPVVQDQLGRQRRERPRQRSLVGPRHRALRMREPLDLRPVSAPDQEPRGVEVEPADRPQLAEERRFAQQLVGRRMARVAERRHAPERLVERQRDAIVERQLLVIDDYVERQRVRGDLAARILHDDAPDLDASFSDHGARGGA